MFIPVSDDNPTLRTPVVTYLLLGVTFAVWLVAQGAGLDTTRLLVSVCNYGLVPGELTGLAPLGLGVPMTRELACVVDDEPVNKLTPLTSMFLHGGWGHLLGNALFLWVFGNNVEDSTGRGRFLVFYVVCGLAAAAAHVLVEPESPVPTVGASGAISGVLGAYLVLYPRVRVNVVMFLSILSLPAWVVLLSWVFWQAVLGLPQLLAVDPEVSGGTAFWAHVGGFVAGAALVKLFENRAVVARREMLRHQLHPGHP